jgi:hypothetical protein
VPAFVKVKAYDCPEEIFPAPVSGHELPYLICVGWSSGATYTVKEVLFFHVTVSLTFMVNDDGLKPLLVTEIVRDNGVTDEFTFDAFVF